MSTPLTLLRLAPLLTSTSSLTFAHDHDLFFRVFTSEPCANHSNTLIPPWMSVYMPRGLRRILFFYPSTLILALLNIYFSNPGSTTRYLYAAGAAFTLGHVAVFGKTAVGLLSAMRDDESKGQATRDMTKWVDMNVWRTLLADLPAWGCYLMGVLGSLKA